MSALSEFKLNYEYLPSNKSRNYDVVLRRITLGFDSFVQRKFKSKNTISSNSRIVK